MKISLIIPMYNESKVIKNTALALSEYMQRNFDSYEIIFSDDGSVDSSVNIVDSLQLPCVRVVSDGKNYGKGHAIKVGVENAEGDIIMFTDADLAYGTDVIAEAYRLLSAADDCGMLVGSRNLDKEGYGNYPTLRKKASKVYIKILGKLGGFDLSDSQCGCKAFKKDAGKKIFAALETNGFAFDIEAILLAGKFGIKIVEMPVKLKTHAESSVSIVRDSIKMLRDLMRIKKRIKKMPRS